MDAGFNRILSLLKRNDPIINTVNVSGIPMSDSMIDKFVDAVNQNSFIGRITLQHNNLTRESLRKIFDLLLSNPKLVNIDVSENDVDDDSIQYLSEILQRLPANRDPISLVLRRNSFGPVGAGHLARNLTCNVPIRWLDLRNNPTVTDRGVEELALSLAQNTTLVGIDLIKCGCDEFGTTALANSLVQKSNVDNFTSPGSAQSRCHSVSRVSAV
jgi:Ran GTPase-activating protein (RanGAP) involved in mRNA processing and transport